MRLIDADMADVIIVYDYDRSNATVSEVREYLKRKKTFLDKFPTIDAVPVRHGRWERTADGAALCTACKQKMNPSQYGYAFCSLCGAKMDG